MIPHLYIHVPFCISKCHYCAFYSVTGAGKSVIDEYPRLLRTGLLLRSDIRSALQPRTIYIGGGTPSLLDVSGFTLLAAVLKDHLDLSRLTEWSVEINPASATRELLEALFNIGVNRITFGAQSFDNHILDKIGRAHSAERTVQAVETARKAGFSNIGLDLIAGLPGTDIKSWLRDLEFANCLNPEHISVYSLSIEPATQLEEMCHNGLAIPDEDLQLEMLRTAETKLAETGFVRYEISNYARPGKECRHNLGIWRGSDYLGLGPAAASRINRERRENLPDLDQWINALRMNRLPPGSMEKLPELDDAMERVLFRLRLQEGLPLEECLENYPQLSGRRESWYRTLKSMAENGAVENISGNWKLTGRGMEICDYVIREMM